MFGRATVRLGIGPHSSFSFWLHEKRSVLPSFDAATEIIMLFENAYVLSAAVLMKLPLT